MPSTFSRGAMLLRAVDVVNEWKKDEKCQGRRSLVAKVRDTGVGEKEEDDVGIERGRSQQYRMEPWQSFIYFTEIMVNSLGFEVDPLLHCMPNLTSTSSIMQLDHCISYLSIATTLISIQTWTATLAELLPTTARTLFMLKLARQQLQRHVLISKAQR